MEVFILERKELISQLQFANNTIITLEDYAGQIDGLHIMAKEIEDKCSDIEFMTDRSATLIVSSIAIFIFLTYTGVPWLPLFWIMVIFIIMVIVYSIYDKPNRKKQANEYYQTYMPGLKAKEEDLLKISKEIYNSKEFKKASELIPQYYFDSESVTYFLDVLINKRADTFKEAINLYEDYLYKLRMEEIQKKQLEIVQENNRLQQEQLKYSKEQLEYSKEQLRAIEEQSEYEKKIARKTRATSRAVHLNTFITILKK